MQRRAVVAGALAVAGALGWLTATHPPARACGHCFEDKIAATYDYAVLTRAAQRGHVVVFTEIRGPAAGADPALKTFVEHAVGTLPGVDAGTVRVSLDPPAASFACDPGRHAPGTMVAAMNAPLSAKGLRLAILEIDHGPRAR